MRLLAACFAAFLMCFVHPQTLRGQTLAFPKVDGWSLAQDETVYTPNNLFDVIDGAADLFLEYEFVDLHIGRYVKGDIEIKAELYKHGTSVDAFGMYSQERFADYHFIDLGVQGYQEKGALNFLSGSFYVKISTIQEGTPAQDAMLLIAKAVEKHLQQAKSFPSTLSAFPTEKKKPYSEQYVAKSFLGYGPLNRVYVAGYEGKELLRAFAIVFETPQNAITTLADLEKSLPKTAQLTKAGIKTVVSDPNNGTIEVLLQGKCMFGVVSQVAGQNHDRFLEEFGKKLSAIK
jgi:hypothetical protein